MSWSSPASKPNNAATQYLFAAGLNYTAGSYAVSAEALIPGPNPPADLARVFFLQLSVVGSTMGSKADLEALIDLLVRTGVRPTIDAVYDLHDARAAFDKLAAGDIMGKIVLTHAG